MALAVVVSAHVRKVAARVGGEDAAGRGVALVDNGRRWGGQRSDTRVRVPANIETPAIACRTAGALLLMLLLLTVEANEGAGGGGKAVAAAGAERRVVPADNNSPIREHRAAQRDKTRVEIGRAVEGMRPAATPSGQHCLYLVRIAQYTVAIFHPILHK